MHPRVSGLKSYVDPILYTAPHREPRGAPRGALSMRHFSHWYRRHPRCTYSSVCPLRLTAPGESCCRVSPQDPGATKHGIPARDHAMWLLAHNRSARSNRRCDIGHAPRRPASAASLLTLVREPSEYKEAAAHGHHGVSVSPAGRGARVKSRIELLPLKHRRREPKELVRSSYTVQHAPTRVRPQVTW